MKLVSAHITSFKSIDDSTPVEIEGGVTCLVGKNESGKTAFLQALRHLNPEEGVSGDFDTLDYPRKGYMTYKRTHAESPAVVVEAKFDLEDSEIQEIRSRFGTEALISSTVTARKGYDNALTWSVEVDEQKALKHLLDKFPIQDAELRRDAGKAEGAAALSGVLSAADPKSAEVQSILSALQECFHPSLASYIADNFLDECIPTFVYFTDYSIMHGKISIDAIQQKVQQNGVNLDEADRTFLALLALAGLHLEDLQHEMNYERVKAELEAASISITDEVFEYWSQNRQLEVEFDLSPANPNEPSPLNTGTILHVRIKNQRHRVSVPFDERSRGFVWFFSFLAHFSQLEDKGAGLILLLDEPGLSLHAKAQGDFLRFIQERLAPKYQVIYTTHSPFMIDPSQLHCVRTVQDIDNRGTVISKDVLRNDRDTVYPLQAALGYDLAQTLFVGPHCLLVEGPSDLLYLQVLSDSTRAKGKASLDPRWVIVPVGGADKLSTFVSLLGGNKLDIAVVIDVAVKDRQRIQNLVSNRLLEKSNLIRINSFTEGSDADIEDLFDPTFYLGLVGEAYDKELQPKLTLSHLPTSGPRIVKRIEQVFKDSGSCGGVFDHYRPASYLVREQARLLPTIDEATLDRFARLFDQVNGLLPARA